MLNRVEIKEFRSCHGVVLEDLGPVTVLVGRNAAGKSNILRAIQWLANTATGSGGPNESGDIALQATIDETVYRYSVQFVGPYQPRQVILFEESLACEDAGGVERTIFERNNQDVWFPSPGGERQISIGAAAPCMPALFSLLPAGSPILDFIRPFLAFLTTIRYYPLVGEGDPADDHRNIVLQRTYDEWLARYQGAGDPGTSVLLRILHMCLTNRPQFEELQSILGPDGLGLLRGIYFESSKMPGPQGSEAETEKWHWIAFTPYLRPGEAPLYLSFNDLSDGTQRVIKILVSLIFDRSGVMLLEHPEDGIHRGLVRKLVDLLRVDSDQSQLIVASHSPVVFNSLSPGAVRIVTMEGGVTKARALSPKELSILEKYLEEEGLLSDFLETIEDD